ncbi:MAG: hypothetical protein NVSMB29_08300 [Candidatus Dormibacteria bacterium]
MVVPGRRAGRRVGTLVDPLRLWRQWFVDPRAPEARMMLRLRQGGITDRLVLAAMASVRREHFVAPDLEPDAYADRALPIAAGQTISQPLMVAILLSALELRGGERVLDVGTGSGYQAAILAACGTRVTSVERLPELARAARRRLGWLGYEVEVVEGDGSLGWPPRAPFDAIAVAARAPDVPPALTAQLNDRGRLVLPVAHGEEEDVLVRVRRVGERLQREGLGSCRFVPLIGEQGYPEKS